MMMIFGTVLDLAVLAGQELSVDSAGIKRMCHRTWPRGKILTKICLKSAMK